MSTLSNCVATLRLRRTFAAGRPLAASSNFISIVCPSSYAGGAREQQRAAAVLGAGAAAEGRHGNAINAGVHQHADQLHADAPAASPAVRALVSNR